MLERLKDWENKRKCKIQQKSNNNKTKKSSLINKASSCIRRFNQKLKIINK